MRFARCLLLVCCLGATASLRASDAASFEAGGFGFAVPAAWRSIPPASPMRKAELLVPGPDGTGDKGAATVTVEWPASSAAACGVWLREWLG